MNEKKPPNTQGFQGKGAGKWKPGVSGYEYVWHLVLNLPISSLRASGGGQNLVAGKKYRYTKRLRSRKDKYYQPGKRCVVSLQVLRWEITASICGLSLMEESFGILSRLVTWLGVVPLSGGKNIGTIIALSSLPLDRDLVNWIYKEKVILQYCLIIIITKITKSHLP
jgi:hypothetical protein